MRSLSKDIEIRIILYFVTTYFVIKWKMCGSVRSRNMDLLDFVFFFTTNCIEKNIIWMRDKKKTSQILKIMSKFCTN